MGVPGIPLTFSRRGRLPCLPVELRRVCSHTLTHEMSMVSPEFQRRATPSLPSILRAEQLTPEDSCLRMRPKGGKTREVTCMTADSEALKTHRDEILAAAARHGARRISVFGSVARGTSTEASDVDFLVEMEKGATLFDRAALTLELRSILGRDVDVVNRKALKPRVRAQIVREAVAL